MVEVTLKNKVLQQLGVQSVWQSTTDIYAYKSQYTASGRFFA